jgi:hypothetical protein
MNVNIAVPGAITGADGATQLPCGIAPEHVIVTGPVKPPRAPIVMVTLAAVPAVVEAVEGRLRLKSKPVPLKAVVCGVPVALSAIESVPVRGLFDVPLGAKLTLMAQVAFTATLTPLHVLVCVKSLDTLIPWAPNVRVAVPVFVTVTVCAALVVVTSWPLKVKGVAGESVTVGVPAVPVPLRTTPCGLLAALSLIERLTGPRAPAALGVKVTLMIHELPGAIVAPLIHVVPVAIANSVVAPRLGAAARTRLALPVFSTVRV